MATSKQRARQRRGVFSSPSFWSVYGALLIVLVATIADFFVLAGIRRRRAAYGYGVWAHEAPNGYYIFCNIIWLALFVPYIFALGSLANQAETGGPMLGVVVLGFVGGLFGGVGTGEMAFNVDKTVKPWAYTYPK